MRSDATVTHVRRRSARAQKTAVDFQLPTPGLVTPGPVIDDQGIKASEIRNQVEGSSRSSTDALQLTLNGTISIKLKNFLVVSSPFADLLVSGLKYAEGKTLSYSSLLKDGPMWIAICTTKFHPKSPGMLIGIVEFTGVIKTAAALKPFESQVIFLQK